MKKNKKIKLIAILILGLSLIVYIVNFFSNARTELSKNPIQLERKIPTDYLNLFNAQVRGNIILQSATSFKLRNTVVNCVYNNEYDIMVTKDSIESGFDLKRDGIEIHKKSKGSAPQTGSSYSQDNFRIIYNAISNSIVSKVYLTIDGDSTANYHKGDSVAYYYSYLKAANFQYKYEGVNELTIEGRNKLPFLDRKNPIIIMFIKRNDWLYFIILSSRSDSTSLSPDTLNKLIQ